MASIFAALGDQTRLGLVRKLCQGEPLSITQLATGSSVSRQAITKHLQTLESARIVRSIHRGRQTFFEFSPQTLDAMHNYLQQVTMQWDQALNRLKDFVED